MLNQDNRSQVIPFLGRVLLAEQSTFTKSNIPAISSDHSLIRASLEAGMGKPTSLLEVLQGLTPVQLDLYTNWVDRISQLPCRSDWWKDIARAAAPMYMQGLKMLGAKNGPKFCEQGVTDQLPLELYGALSRTEFRYLNEGLCPELMQEVWVEFLEVEKAASLLHGRPLHDYELWQYAGEAHFNAGLVIQKNLTGFSEALRSGALEERTHSAYQLFQAEITEALLGGKELLCDFEFKKYFAARGVLSQAMDPVEAVLTFIRLKPFFAPYPGVSDEMSQSYRDEMGCLYAIQSTMRMAIEDRAPTRETVAKARPLIKSLLELKSVLHEESESLYSPGPGDYLRLSQQPELYIGAALACGKA